MLNKGKKIAYDLGMIGVVQVITGGFVKGGLSNNAHKRHLWAVIAIENKKVKATLTEKGLIIYSLKMIILKGLIITMMTWWQ